MPNLFLYVMIHESSVTVFDFRHISLVFNTFFRFWERGCLFYCRRKLNFEGISPWEGGGIYKSIQLILTIIFNKIH